MLARGMVAFIMVARPLLAAHLSDFVASFRVMWESDSGNLPESADAEEASPPSLVVECVGERCSRRRALLGQPACLVIPPARICQNCHVVTRRTSVRDALTHYAPVSTSSSRFRWLTATPRTPEEVRAHLSAALGLSRDARRIGEALSLAGFPWRSSTGSVVMPCLDGVWLLRCSCRVPDAVDHLCLHYCAWSGFPLSASGCCTSCCGNGPELHCHACLRSWHIGCTPWGPVLRFPGTFWLCVSCLVSCARQFHSMDWKDGFSSWRLRRSRSVLDEASSALEPYVGRPSPAVVTSRGPSVGPLSAASPGISPPGISATKRRRRARCAGLAPESTLPPLARRGLLRLLSQPGRSRPLGLASLLAVSVISRPSRRSPGC